MKSEILTEELLKELLSRPNVDSFADDDKLSHEEFNECLAKFLEEKGMSRKDVIHKTSINETHAYQIFAGTRGASRNKVIQIALAMGLSLRQTNRLLHSAGVSSLYCKDRQDAIIIFGIEHGFDLQKIDDVLYQFGEETLTNE